MSVCVVTAEEAAARDAAAIESGIPSLELMRTAGVRAAAEIRRRFGERLAGGVIIYCGAGNNGGDGWVIAGEFARGLYPVRVVEVGAPRSDDAVEAKRSAMTILADAEQVMGPNSAAPSIVVDALLGIGTTGAPRGAFAAAIREIAEHRTRGAKVVCIDLPSGLDATTGSSHEAVEGDLTLTFGSVKRGHLISRDACGEIVCLDIGLGPAGSARDRDVTLVDSGWVHSRLPRLPANAHKGTRGKVAIVGGGIGMAGAAILSARAALRSGAGLVRAIVHPENRDAVHTAVPSALVSGWPRTTRELEEMAGWADVMVIGPGLGRTRESEIMGTTMLEASGCPLLVDADMLNVFEGDTGALARAVGGRTALLTPHPLEMSRLVSTPVEAVLDRRFEIGCQLASECGATVLLKGTPTVISAVDGRRLVSAAGTPALATGGSGDVLAGIIGALMVRIPDTLNAAACAAWIHGRAAELCGPGLGVVLEDVLYAMAAAWNERAPLLPPPILARLPGIA